MERLIVIVGPTAVGKTQISISLAEKLQTEIISGDSMLVYRGMNIGTAKPSLSECRGILHHLIDILEPDSEFSVVDFQKLAGELITAINLKNKIPILVGGTGLYIKALLEGYRFNRVSGSEEIRQRITKLAQDHGNEYVHSLLAKASPETAAKLHPNDLRRVVRALEIHQLSNEQVSNSKQSDCGLIFDAVVLGLTMNRERLYQRINSRVDAMVSGGLIEEVAALINRGIPINAQAMQGIGYKEIAAYLRNETDLPTACDLIKQSTRNFAKRQLTWFRRMTYIDWVDVDTFDNENKLLAYIYSLLAGKFNLE